MKKICQHCGKEFETTNSRKIYCTRDCMYKAKNLRKVKELSENSKKNFQKYIEENGSKRNCLYCGKEFEITKPQQLRKIYCSKSCCKKVDNMFGNKEERDKKYKDILRYGGNKEKALIRDKYSCYFCSSSDDLVIHHIDFTGQTNDPNNELDNLVTLCRSCHIKLHKIAIKPNV